SPGSWDLVARGHAARDRECPLLGRSLSSRRRLWTGTPDLQLYRRPFRLSPLSPGPLRGQRDLLVAGGGGGSGPRQRIGLDLGFGRHRASRRVGPRPRVPASHPASATSRLTFVVVGSFLT